MTLPPSRRWQVANAPGFLGAIKPQIVVVSNGPLTQGDKKQRRGKCERELGAKQRAPPWSPCVPFWARKGATILASIRDQGSALLRLNHFISDGKPQ
jgi:hypothetical protein